MPHRSSDTELLEELVEAGMVSEAAARRALAATEVAGKGALEALVATGELSEDDAMQLRELQFQLPYTHLENTQLDPEAVRLIPEEFARRERVIAISVRRGELTVAVSDPLNVMVQDEVRRITGKRVLAVLANPREVERAIDRYYRPATELEGAIQEIGQHLAEIAEEDVPDIAQLEEMGRDAPIVNLVNTLLQRALQQRASDIHLEPGTADAVVRCRVDGVLRDILAIPMKVYPAVISRLKIIGGMDISERRVPQDGRFSAKLDGRTIDFRASTLPTVGGEKIVLRILDKAKGQVKLEEMGLSPMEFRRLEAAIARPHGMFIVTGPTGSGKTTTLYAVLQRLNARGTNIVTCEDPVEYQLDRINQVQLNARAGLTFGTFLRSVLRQDPDIIMVGEMRDAETAELGMRAAMTGHLVLSTLHTNDAAGAANRLIDMGVEPYLVASTLTGSLAQRLVRTICPHCAEEYTASKEDLEVLGICPAQDSALRVRRGRGCRGCNETGYAGRKAVFELLVPTLEMRRLIAARAGSGELCALAQAGGMISLRQAAVAKVLAGETTVQEAARVTADSTAG